MIGRERAFDDAAIGVAADDDVGNAQDAGGVLDGGGNAAKRIGIQRNNIADDAADEQLAGDGLRQQAGVDARVRAGDEERIGALTHGQFLEEFAAAGIDVALELGDAAQEFFDGHTLR